MRDLLIYFTFMISILNLWALLEIAKYLGV